MDVPDFRPELWKGEWKRPSSRKRQFGRYDFERFPKLPINIASVGEKSIGKAHVDCRFLFNESKWGVLQIDGRRWPAGIVRLDLTFTPIRGYKLMWATIKVTLDGEHKDLEPWRDKSIIDPAGLVLLRHWGPDQIVGAPVTVSEKKTRHGTPSVTFPQGGVSGVGRDGEQSFEHDVRWVFTGNPRRNNTRGMTYNSLEWHLWENDLESQSSHGNRFQTAFAFANSGQPFLMKVEIDGGLHKIHHRLLEKLKFGSHKHGEENISTTLVRGFNGRMEPLNELADRLNDDMKLKNGDIGYAKKPDARDAASNPPAATGTLPLANPTPADGVQKPGVSTEEMRNMSMSLISPKVKQQIPTSVKHEEPEVKVETPAATAAENGTVASVVKAKVELQKGTTILQMLLYIMQYWLKYISELLDGG
jgi:hypothetical protein